jgi:hypothetical protein
MEAVCISEKTLYFNETTMHYILEGSHILRTFDCDHINIIPLQIFLIATRPIGMYPNQNLVWVCAFPCHGTITTFIVYSVTSDSLRGNRQLYIYMQFKHPTEFRCREVNN